MDKDKVNETKATILVVDDVPANLNLLREALEPEGYEILGAPSGEIALQIADRIVPDLILLDIVMKGIDGFETCRRLKADPKTADVPVIFITARNETNNVVEGFHVGGLDYIIKPFQENEVRVRVQTHLTIKRLRDKLEESYRQLEAEDTRKTEELERARVIQQGFLPTSPPEIPYLDIAAFQEPATEVGGDYYDFSPQKDGGLILAIGDATGHGASASLMVSATKTALLAVDEPHITKRLGKVNALLKQVNRDHLLNMALILAEFSHDAESSSVQVKATGGGMPPLYILRAGGGVEEVRINGLPLGVVEEPGYKSTEFRLEESDVLVLMSDGLPERVNDSGEMPDDTQLLAELERIGKANQGAEEILEALVEYGNDWSNGTPQDDDITLVVLKAI
jgi:sigma-B regulation protein RsbU (phosphoserine phosphatase)